MREPDRESDVISPRRRLLEEVLVERSKVVAALPAELEHDPPGASMQWPTGVIRLLWRVPRALLGRRRVALKIAVVAVAWLEAIDRDLELPAEGGVGGQKDPVG